MLCVAMVRESIEVRQPSPASGATDEVEDHDDEQDDHEDSNESVTHLFLSIDWDQGIPRRAGVKRRPRHAAVCSALWKRSRRSRMAGISARAGMIGSQKLKRR